MATNRYTMPSCTVYWWTGNPKLLGPREPVRESDPGSMWDGIWGPPLNLFPNLTVGYPLRLQEGYRADDAYIIHGHHGQLPPIHDFSREMMIIDENWHVPMVVLDSLSQIAEDYSAKKEMEIYRSLPKWARNGTYGAHGKPYFEFSGNNGGWTNSKETRRRSPSPRCTGGWRRGEE